MSRRAALVLLIGLLATSARADFDRLLDVVASQPGLHRISTPGMSWVRLGIRMLHPEGVHDFQLATFEGEAKFGAAEFDALLRTSRDNPIIRVHSNRTGETTIIWSRPVGESTVEMLIMSHDPGDETVVLRAVVDATFLAREMADPRHAGSHFDR